MRVIKAGTDAGITIINTFGGLRWINLGVVHGDGSFNSFNDTVLTPSSIKRSLCKYGNTPLVLICRAKRCAELLSFHSV